MQANTQRLVILGAAESGIGAALLGKQQGWDVFVSDAGKLKDNFRAELEQNGIAWEEGGHTAACILNADCIVKSPGIPEKAAIIQQVRAAGIYLCSEIEFGYRYKGNGRIIAITGSNGKSTTTKLTHHLLHKAGYDVAMAGNIGYSFARQIALKPCAWYVIEVSSFQLDDIHDFRPDIAVLLNITPDHLDRYKYDFANYIAAKFRITENQLPTDRFIVNQDDKVIQEYMANHSVHAKIIYFTMNESNRSEDGAFINNDRMTIHYEGENMEMSVNDLSLRGRHNQYNSMAAGISARSAGIRTEALRGLFAGFTGLEHRLEYVAMVRGVEFINDSKATNMNSVWYALESMRKPTILILGGQDKGNDYTEIRALVAEKVKVIICLGVDNTPIHHEFDNVIDTIADTASAAEAVHAAYAFAEKGDVVLLAPGCASFDRFNNFEDRGTQFKEAVKAL